MATKRKNSVSSLVRDAAPVTYVPTKEDKARERRYRAEDALNTLTRAEEIKRDKGLMRDVKACAQAKMKELSSVTRKR